MTRKKAVVSNLIFVLLFIQTFASFSTAQASGTGISVNPSSLTASMGDNITITITAGNVTNLYGWQAAIKYNASIINCTGVWLPADNVFAGLSQIPVPPILNDPTNDGLNYVLWGVSLFSGAVSFVQGTLFKLNFTVVGYGETVIQIGTKQNPIQYNPGFPQTWYTYLQDPDLNEIPFIEENGNVVVRATKAQVTFTQTGARALNLRQKFIQLKKFLTISEQPRVEAEKVESLKSAISKLQEELTQQKLITDTISEGNITIKNENVDLRERIIKTEQRLAELERLARQALEQTG